MFLSDSIPLVLLSMSVSGFASLLPFCFSSHISCEECVGRDAVFHRAASRDLSLEATSTDFAHTCHNVFPAPPLPDQLHASVEDCHLENGEECSFENGEERILENGESRDSSYLENGESHGPIWMSSDPVSVDLVAVRRPVRQRWYYAPVVSDPVLVPAPSRVKRQSKPPRDSLPLS
jgi:hypothetical protein